jgi:rod shape-determining protein MreD
VIRLAAYALTGFLLLAVQTALLPHLLPAHLKPDLLLPLAVHLGVRSGYLRGGLLAYGLGCLEDVYTGSYLGLNGAALLLVFLAVRGNAHRLNTESSFLLLFLVACGTLLQTGVQLFALGFFVDEGSYAGQLLALLPLQLLLNAAAALLLLRVATRLRRRFSRRPGGAGWPRLDRRYGS